MATLPLLFFSFFPAQPFLFSQLLPTDMGCDGQCLSLSGIGASLRQGL